MQITRYGHSCLHVVDRDGQVLIDPGTFSSGFEQLTGLTAVLITHQHADHVDLDRLPALLAANPQAAVYSDTATAEQLQGLGIRATAVRAGDTFDVGTPVSVHGQEHAVIHRDIPVIPNAEYLVGGRLLHPGDALHVPGIEVEILALPTMAPWMALKEAVDFYRAVGAAQALPIHDAIPRPQALPMYYGRFADLGPHGSTFHSVAPDGTIDL